MDFLKTSKYATTLVALCLGFYSADSFALTQTANGIVWTYDVISGGAVVKSIPKDTKGAVVVPSTLGGSP